MAAAGQNTDQLESCLKVSRLQYRYNIIEILANGPVSMVS